jgi:UDPglucose 6-dehydrogenase
VLGDSIGYHGSAYDAVKGADAAVLVTEWPEFRALDLSRVKRLMRGAVFVDSRNLYGMRQVSVRGCQPGAPGRQSSHP